MSRDEDMYPDLSFIRIGGKRYPIHQKAFDVLTDRIDELEDALRFLAGALEHPAATKAGRDRGVLEYVPEALERARAALSRTEAQQ